MNPLKGQRLVAFPDPLAKGFSTDELQNAMYELTADPEQEALMLEPETLAVLDSCYVEGEPVLTGFVLDAVTTSFARFPRVMQALQRALNRGTDVKVVEHEIGTPKKNSMFATVSVQFKLSDGQVLTVVFHAPDEDPKVFKPDDIVIAFRWLLNKRDITHVVTPEMVQGKMKDVSLPTVAKRVGSLIAANTDKFQAKQKEVSDAKAALEELELEKAKLSDELTSLTAEIAELNDEKESEQQIVNAKSSGLQKTKEYNDKLRDRIAELQQLINQKPKQEPEPQTETETEPEKEPVEPYSKEAADRLSIMDSKFYRELTGSMAAIASIDSGDSNGEDRKLFVSSIVNKIKTKHKNQQQELVDAALDYIKETNERLAKPLITDRNGVWKLHSNAAGTPEEKEVEADQADETEPSTSEQSEQAEVEPVVQEETEQTEQPEAVVTLENIVNGLHDDVSADDVLELIEEAVEQLEAKDLVEQYDDLIGAAAEKYAELDEKQE